MLYHLNIGSNLGERQEHIDRAIAALDGLGQVAAVSQPHESEPWGFESDNQFVNVAVAIESELEPMEMLRCCQGIERELGSASHRDGEGNYVDRVIDIDIIMAGDLRMETPELTLPHPRMYERDFVMQPLLEVVQKLQLPLRLEVPAGIETSVALPTSKSIAARMLVINALSKAPMRLQVNQSCEDIDVMSEALTTGGDTIDVHASGTAMRLLTAYLACRDGRTVTLTGTERLCQRPIAPLVDALRQRGAKIEYMGKEGYPPLRIKGSKMLGNEVTIDASLSSQYVTALLLIAPVTGGCVIRLEGEISSRPYIEMTLGLMRRSGIAIDSDESLRTITVHEGEYRLPEGYTIEADWSAASYLVAWQALLPQSHIAIEGLTPTSLQGDSTITGMMKHLGVKGEWKDGTLHLEGCEPTTGLVELDMTATPDIVPTIAVALCLQRRPFTITGVENLRIKESDRIAAVQAELAKVGYTVLAPTRGSIAYDGNHSNVDSPAPIATHKDHRIAMAMSLAATRHPGITIENPEVIVKSYPCYWTHLASAGVNIEPMGQNVVEKGYKNG